MKHINWLDHFFNIVAVILGVSLAFIVNDRAEQSKLRKEKDLLLNEIISDLEEDLEVFQDYQIPDNEDQITKLDSIVSLISNRSISDDHIDLFQGAIGINNYAPTNTMFRELAKSSKIDFISNREVRNDLMTYYDVDGIEAEFRNKMQIKFYEEQLLPWLMDNVLIDDPEMDKIGQFEFKNRLIIYRSLIQNKVRQYRRLLTEGEELSKLLREEIEK